MSNATTPTTIPTTTTSGATPVTVPTAPSAATAPWGRCLCCHHLLWPVGVTGRCIHCAERGYQPPARRDRKDS